MIERRRGRGKDSRKGCKRPFFRRIQEDTLRSRILSLVRVCVFPSRRITYD